MDMDKISMLEFIADLKAMERTVGNNKDGKNPLGYITWFLEKGDFDLSKSTFECLSWYFMIECQCNIKGIK